jgi:hypothetical protein
VINIRSEGLTIFTIATNKYWDYFLELLPNLRNFIDCKSNLEVIVLTNRHPQGVMETRNHDLTIRVLPSEFNDWPEVTLMRYDQILKFENEISTNRFLWLDVDMLFIKKFNPKMLKNGIYLAPHPGFNFNWRGFVKLKNSRKRGFLRDKVNRIIRRQFGRGAWETNLTSAAFVSPKMQRTYVHGAVWGGDTSRIIEMCQILRDRINLDLANNYIATWHDESHLNWFHAHYPQKLFSKHFSGANNHWTSNTSQSILLSLDKETLDKKLGL